MLQERLHKKLDVLAAGKSPPRKPSIAGCNEVAALRASLAAQEEEAAALREQVRDSVNCRPAIWNIGPTGPGRC